MRKCDLVIVVASGCERFGCRSTDYDLATASSKIDVIIGGHSHKMIVNETVKMPKRTNDNNTDGKV